MESKDPTLTVQSRINFNMRHGRQARNFIETCENFSMALSDSADGERSGPLRAFMSSLSKDILQMSERLEKVLSGSDEQ